MQLRYTARGKLCLRYERSSLSGVCYEVEHWQFLGCVHRRNSYIRFNLGFHYGRFSCDGSRFLCIIIMHCIVNVENHQY